MLSKTIIIAGLKILLFRTLKTLLNFHVYSLKYFATINIVSVIGASGTTSKRSLESGLRLFSTKQALAQVWNQYLQGLPTVELTRGEVHR